MAVCVLIVFYMAMSIGKFEQDDTVSFLVTVMTQMCGSKKKKPAAGAKSEVPMSAIDATGAAASNSQVKKPDEEKKEEEKKEEEKKEE